MTDKAKMIFWYIGLAALLALLSYVAYMRGHSTVAILVIIIPAAVIANGFFAEIEDNAPGGFLSGIRHDSKAKEKTRSKDEK